MPALLEGIYQSGDTEKLFSLAAENQDFGTVKKMAQFMRGDPQTQLAWATHALGENTSEKYIQNILYHTARETTDGYALVKWLEQNSSVPYDSLVFDYAVQAWAKTDPAAAIQWATSASASRASGALASAVLSWSNEDHAAAMVWSMDHLDQPRIQNILPFVIGNVAAFDPQSAADTVERLDPKLVSKEIVEQVAKHWVRRFPAE